MDCGDIGRRTHGLELLGVLFLRYILAFVNLEEDMGSIPHHVRRLIGGKEYLPGVAQLQDIAHLGFPDSGVAPIVQPLLETHHGDDCLRLEGRGTFYGVAATLDEEGEQQHLELSRKLVFTALTGDLHREGQPSAVDHTVGDSLGYF